MSDEDGGGYLALAPDLKGCMGDGATPQEAIADVIDAIKEWSEEAIRLNRQIPTPYSQAKKHAKERKEITKYIETQSKLVNAQRDLLDAQKQAIKKAQDDVDLIKKRLESVSAQQLTWEEEEFGWSGAPSQLVALALKKSKRSKDRDITH